MDSAKAQLADKIKASSNILVTVSRNPSVDQLSALLGLTLTLNKMGKHAAAVFSGQTPSTLEFLQPQETIEKNTDSLRDFIIALDKSKADKLRYKVEDDVVRIFITPYKTSISDADLEFSQGDFNVDVVIAIGVLQQENLDEAITAHGRILHDATVATINVVPDSGLGSINWYDEQTSSLSELVTELVQALDPSLLDEQISTALLTGIVAETSRFSNEKTSSQTMSLSAALMAAGANQQLVATKLEESHTQPPDNNQNDDKKDNGDSSTDGGSPSKDPKPDDGTIEIDHQNDKKDEPGDESSQQPSFDLPKPLDNTEQDTQTEFPGVIIDEEPQAVLEEEPRPQADKPEPIDVLSPGPKIMIEPPSLGGRLTANSTPEMLDPSIDPLTMTNESLPTLLSRENEQPLPVLTPHPTHTMMTAPPASWTPPAPDDPTPAPAPTPGSTPPTAPEPAPEPAPEIEPKQELTAPELKDTKSSDDKTLTELEASVGSVHLSSPDLGDARDEVSRALGSDTNVPAPQPIAALNAQPLGGSLHASNNTDEVPVLIDPNDANSDPAFIGPMLEDILGPQKSDADTAAPAPQVTDSTAPPPVPPPLPFKFGNSNSS